MGTTDPYYRRDLARVHHLGYGFHADACAPGILALLEPLRERGGLVLELGCGSGLLMRHLTQAGHRVVATDASPANARAGPGTSSARKFIERPPGGSSAPQPPTRSSRWGHVLSYLPVSLLSALVAAAAVLRPRASSRSTSAISPGGRRAGTKKSQGRVGDDLGDRRAIQRSPPATLTLRDDDLPPRPGRHLAARRRAPRERAGGHLRAPALLARHGLEVRVSTRRSATRRRRARRRSSAGASKPS